MNSQARKIILPRFKITEIAEEIDSASNKVVIEVGAKKKTYYIRPKLAPAEASYREGEARWNPTQFNAYPVILQSDGSPWAEANLFILSGIVGRVHPNISTFLSLADDLTAYLRFIEEKDLDWITFPSQKIFRPTYRFNGYLRTAINAGELAASTAKRRMSSVIRFYRWLIEEGLLVPEHLPWKEGDRYVQFEGHYGEKRAKRVITTDISINVPLQDDPYNGYITDGEKLRPLPQHEQEWLLDALLHLGNTEMTLIHLFSLVTGARIQTVLTFRVHHVLKDHVPDAEGLIRYPVGPGTGINTKNNKKLILHIPAWFYEKLQIYASSERAKKRRIRAVGGDNENQYLFLSIRGAPMYSAKEDRTHEMEKGLRHEKNGQAVRQFISTYIIPYIREKQNASGFHYRPHDLRATYGMNLVDSLEDLVDSGKITKTRQFDLVRSRLGHTSIATTERYLDFRSRLHVARAVQDEWETRIKKMSEALI
ncbi:site-specific integrase [Oxalobacteraceae bacterium R-40]|uniref:Site-specific integrase n=1 Tax=Keguizhuia sedimenti TaxID=3064264 RepID=A0ABU1BK31_9BURK|nr:site-specific integrase [Oxalobacteraceae bacterium R-40]